MSVEITFAEDGGQGLVAPGTSLWEAAKRLGVPLRADCKGRGECDSGAVTIRSGSNVLSPVTEFEEARLGERLAAAERLACQAKVVKAGQVAVQILPAVNGAAEKTVLRDAPLGQQVGAFIEVQATMMSEAVNVLLGKSNALVAKFLNLDQDKQSSTQPRPAESEKPGAKQTAANQKGATSETGTGNDSNQ